MPRGKDIKIISGNSNIHFAEAICAKLGQNLCDVLVQTFPDGEISVSMNESVRGSDVFIVQSTCRPVNSHLMEMLILIDACKRASAYRITAVMPYFGYAQQDRKFKSRDPISAKLVANLITAAGADRVLTMDLHATQIQGFFDIPVDHMLAAQLFAAHYQNHFPDVSDVMVVSPDVGGVRRARAFADRMGMELAVMDKRRDEENQVEIMNIIGDVEGKRIILYDDIVETAGTLCKAAIALEEIGKAREVYSCASHGVLSENAIELVENSNIKELLLTDTIPFPNAELSDKIKYITAAQLFTDAIDCIFNEQAVSTVFE